MIPPMDDLGLRLVAWLRVLVPFVFFMASIYLALHMVFARFVAADRPSPTLWFFSVVTGPLTRPVRAVLPAGTPEHRVRAIALAVYVMLWMASGALLNQLIGPAAG
jgi:hypothetical protein